MDLTRGVSRRQFLRSLFRPESPTGVEAARSSHDQFSATSLPFDQSITARPPVLEPNWTLTVDGAVRAACQWRREDLQEFPVVSRECALVCSGSTAAHQLVHQRVWSGIPVSALLDWVEPLAESVYARVQSRDGYATCLTLDELKAALFVVHPLEEPTNRTGGMNGRLVVPGRAGYKMAKWVERITLSATPVPGYWEERGWPLDGRVSTLAYFTRPTARAVVSSPVVIAGMAYAGDRALSAVEISVDDGPWMPVPHQPSHPGALTNWSITWEAPGPGDYLLRVRALDDGGADVAPVGSSVPHDIVIRVG